ncbi:uncharacterized protein [Mytilus edulis]|uniref:uncharacterized protein n=1 Tax=Mytilus edulis TaxID=6550 RepID=UPI0039F0877D
MNLKLRSIRAGHRSAVSRLIKKFEDVQQEEDGTVDTEDLSNILDSLKRKQEILRKLDEDIVQELDDGDIETEIVEADEYAFNLEGKIRQVIKFILVKTTSLNTHAESFTPRIETTQPIHTINSSYTEHQNNSNYRLSDFRPSFSSTSEYNKLPKLNLPTFDGDILQWQSFWDSFETAVHTNPTLSNVQKFNYLKSLLHDEALKSVTGFALTNANYEKAISLLQERYGQQHKITQRYMLELIDITSPRYTLFNLRHFYDNIEIYIRGLESLGQTDESYGALLVPIILNKLPGEIRKNLARQFGSTNIRLADLRKGIFNEINIMEAGNSTDSHENPTATAAFLTNTIPRNRQSSHNHQNKNHQNTYFKSKQCDYCHESHASVNCTKVAEYQDRISIVERDHLCFNCLGHHNLVDCKSIKSCRKCDKRHYTSLCKENTHNDYLDSVNVSTIQHNAKEPDTISHSQATTNVLLKTATNPVRSGRHCSDANILFDEGAQRSFITEDLVVKLQLSIISTETLNLSGFGDSAESTRIRHLKTSIIYLLTEEGQLPIRVLIVPEIAVPLKTYIRKAVKLPYLSGIELAHPVTANDNFHISLLVGADYYWSIVENHIIRGEGPTSVKSKIGYLLSGPLHSTPRYNNQQTATMNVRISQKTEECNPEKLRKTESFGIEHIDERTGRKKVFQVLDSYQKTCISNHDNRHFDTLSRKDDHTPSPVNKEISKWRKENVIK